MSESTNLVLNELVSTRKTLNQQRINLVKGKINYLFYSSLNVNISNNNRLIALLMQFLLFYLNYTNLGDCWLVCLFQSQGKNQFFINIAVNNFQSICIFHCNIILGDFSAKCKVFFANIAADVNSCSQTRYFMFISIFSEKKVSHFRQFFSIID